MTDLRQIIADELADRFENDDTLDLPEMDDATAHRIIDRLARAVAGALLNLAVEQRMDAMKMRLAGWLHTDPGKCNHIKGTRHCTNTGGTWIPLYVEATQ